MIKLKFYLSNMFYIIGINIINILLIKYNSYNMFQSYLLSIFVNIYFIINSFIFTLLDKDLILTTFKNMFNYIKDNKLTYSIIFRSVAKWI